MTHEDIEVILERDVFDAKQAAKFLGISRATFQVYTSKRKVIRGIRKGNADLYTRPQLEELRERYAIKSKRKDNNSNIG